MLQHAIPIKTHVLCRCMRLKWLGEMFGCASLAQKRLYRCAKCANLLNDYWMILVPANTSIMKLLNMHDKNENHAYIESNQSKKNINSFSGSAGVHLKCVCSLACCSVCLPGLDLILQTCGSEDRELLPQRVWVSVLWQPVTLAPISNSL